MNPSDQEVEAKIVLSIQLEGLHDPLQLLERIQVMVNMFEYNRQMPPKFFVSPEQFNRVVENLVSRQILVRRNGQLFQHQNIVSKIKPFAPSKKSSLSEKMPCWAEEILEDVKKQLTVPPKNVRVKKEGQNLYWAGLLG